MVNGEGEECGRVGCRKGYFGAYFLYFCYLLTTARWRDTSVSGRLLGIPGDLGPLEYGIVEGFNTQQCST